MTIFARFCVPLLLVLAACSGRTPPVPSAAMPAAVSAAAPQRPLVILISVDGLRADYLRRGITPNIAALAARGVTTPAMRPSFPSLTFPNHYTLVTGLRPDRHGIVSNTMEDAALGKFSLSNRAAVEDRRWWDGAEPIWVTAQKAGISAATMFWPGSEAAVRGVRPAHWLAFDGKMPEPARVDRLLAWLDETPRPGLGTLYFDSVDHDGHEFGPDAPQTNAAIAAVDVQVGRLVTGLEARGIAANIVLVADHGMAPVSTDRQIMLDDLLPATSYRLVTGGAVAGIMSNPGQAAGVAPALLRRHAHMQCWRKSAIPRRLHYGRHPRVPDLVCVAAPGWMIWARAPKLAEGARAMALGGMHGYDPAAPDMAASFVAAGPAFRAGKVLAPFDNVDVHPLLLHLLGLPPMQTDGRLRPLRPGLRHR